MPDVKKPKEKPVGAMKDVYTELVEGIQSVDARCEELGVCMSETNKRLDTLVPLIGELATRFDGLACIVQRSQDLTSRVDSKIDHQVQRLLDRVIEMAMVNQGKPTEAAVHRTRSDNAFSSQDAWSVGSEQNPDDVWPPPGCDSMELRG